MTKREAANSSSDATCFLISPIGPPGSPVRRQADKVKQFIVVPTAERVGLQVIRSDDISETGLITNQVIRHLLEDRVVVADLTGHNPNVFYELALRHAAGTAFAHLIAKDSPIPFDVAHARAIEYDIDDPQSVADARAKLEKVMHSALKGEQVESPVTVAAGLREFFKTSSDNQDVVTQIVRQYDEIASTVADIRNTLLSPGLLRDAIPSFVRDQMESMLRRYANEIELLKAIREAGIIGVARRRTAVVEQLKAAIDEEDKDILIVGSSLKGLLQNSEYEGIREKLCFKSKIEGFSVRFLLTHPVFADFRASQEQRDTSNIGKEIIVSLRILKEWELDPKNVRLYLGTPTAFAIRTSRKMFINPYPYRTEAYESPCIVVRGEKGSSETEHAYYFYEHFSDAHFGAWGTNLSVKIDQFDSAIAEFEGQLGAYGARARDIIDSVKRS